MHQQQLLDERPHVRGHQRPAERMSVLYLEQVGQEHTPGLADHAQCIVVALVSGDVEAVAW